MDEGPDIVDKLQHIEDVLTEIRDGRYEPPKGTTDRIIATPEDLYHELETVVGLLERQNVLIYNLGKVFCEAQDGWKEGYWSEVNSRNG